MDSVSSNLTLSKYIEGSGLQTNFQVKEKSKTLLSSTKEKVKWANLLWVAGLVIVGPSKAIDLKDKELSTYKAERNIWVVLYVVMPVVKALYTSKQSII